MLVRVESGEARGWCSLLRRQSSLPTLNFGLAAPAPLTPLQQASPLGRPYPPSPSPPPHAIAIAPTVASASATTAHGTDRHAFWLMDAPEVMQVRGEGYTAPTALCTQPHNAAALCMCVLRHVDLSERPNAGRARPGAAYDSLREFAFGVTARIRTAQTRRPPRPTSTRGRGDGRPIDVLPTRHIWSERAVSIGPDDVGGARKFGWWH